MTLDETLQEDLLHMLIPERRGEIKALIREYHGKFFTGDVRKEEVAMFSFMVAAALKPGMAEECAGFLKDAFDL